MADNTDADKTQREMFETLKKMMNQGFSVQTPQTDKVEEGEEESKKKSNKEKLRFDLKPKEVKKHLDRFVIKQEDAKKVLATAVCDHYNHVRMNAEKKTDFAYSKQNIVIMGPTGVGKTHLVRHLADLIGVPFIKADATKFSETGYAGGDVEDLVRDLVAKADGDIELAQYGMVYLDEIDKLAVPNDNIGRDVSGSGVQRGLLKIMEETEVPLRNPQDLQSQFQSVLEFQKKGKFEKPMINTRHILFIASGSFDGIGSIIEKRMAKAEIGFSGKTNDKQNITELLKEVQTEDFTKFGFESEFIGRLPVRVVCHQLLEEDLNQILSHSEDSILKQHVAAFEAYGIKMNVEEKALWEIAKKAAKEKTGARGLFTVCEKVFRSLKYELPSSKLKEFSLTPELVISTDKKLQDILKDERQERSREILGVLEQFENNFFEKNNIRIQFDQNARDALITKVLDEEMEVADHLTKLLSNYAYGLRLIQQKDPRDTYQLPAEVIEHPNRFLDRWIKEVYEN